MFTHKDIALKTIYVLNCIEERTLRVSNGELLFEDTNEKKTLTKLPFQKILAIFVVGHISITTPLIDKCKRFNVSLVVMKPSFRIAYMWNNNAEANFLLRKKQCLFEVSNLSIAKALVLNKMKNQKTLLNMTRLTGEQILKIKGLIVKAEKRVLELDDYNKIMGLEGFISKHFFDIYFGSCGWNRRMPRAKPDYINASLDIGYTILFNYLEIFVRMFGFDPYFGVYHRLWFKRKSLICDLMEPFRCIIDHQVRIAIAKKRIKESDFLCLKNEFRLKLDKNQDYIQIFYEALIPYKMDVFKYIQQYYRCFMADKPIAEYPLFEFK